MDDEFVVNGLALPALLVVLLQGRRWQHPGDEKLGEVIPFLHDRVIFLQTVKSIRMESSGHLADSPRSSQLFHLVRGSKSTVPVELPWLDADRALFIAVNEEIGDDVVIALDYSTSIEDPRVVASEWLQNEHIWREVTSTFSEFVERLGLK